MHHIEVEENLVALGRFRALIERNREALIAATTADNWISAAANAGQLDRGIATLSSYQQSAATDVARRSPLGGIAIFSSYNDPLFGTLGMSMGAALVVCGSKRPIVLKFPGMLRRTAALLRSIVVESGEFPEITFSELNGAQFMQRFFADARIGVVQVYGGPWVQEYIGRATETRTALRFEGPGNNPAIIHASADLHDAVRKIVNMGYTMSGQACVVTKRVICDRRISMKRLRAALDERIIQLTWSEDPHSGAHVAPIKNDVVAQRLQRHHAQALASGARCENWSTRHVTIGGESGTMFSPSVFYDVDPSMDIFREESFGPVLTVMAADEAELTNLADATDYKLTASVFGDPSETRSIVHSLRASHGMVMVNETANEAVDPRQGYTGPWGGYGISSFYVGPDTGWRVETGPMPLTRNFSRCCN